MLSTDLFAQICHVNRGGASENEIWALVRTRRRARQHGTAVDRVPVNGVEALEAGGAKCDEVWQSHGRGGQRDEQQQDQKFLRHVMGRGLVPVRDDASGLRRQQSLRLAEPAPPRTRCVFCLLLVCSARCGALRARALVCGEQKPQGASCNCFQEFHCPMEGTRRVLSAAAVKGPRRSRGFLDRGKQPSADRLGELQTR